MIIGIIMAGGKGSRLGLNVEKPLLELFDKPLIDYTLENMLNSKVDKVILALSPNTPETLDYICGKGIVEFDSFESDVSYFLTSGDGYLDDYNSILGVLEKFSREDTVVFINSDLPFVDSGVIDLVLDEYFSVDFDALSVFLPESVFVDLGLDFDYSFRGRVPVGLNVVRSENIVQSQFDLLLDIPYLALNINTENNLQVALKFLEENDGV